MTFKHNYECMHTNIVISNCWKSSYTNEKKKRISNRRICRRKVSLVCKFHVGLSSLLEWSREAAQQIKSNARALAAALMRKGYKIMTDGTENHIVLWDLRPCGLTGSKVCNRMVFAFAFVLCGGIGIQSSLIIKFGFGLVISTQVCCKKWARLLS